MAGSRRWTERKTFGLAGNDALDALVAETGVNLRFHHAMSSKAYLCEFPVPGRRLETAAQGGGATGMLAAAGRGETGISNWVGCSAGMSPRLRTTQNLADKVGRAPSHCGRRQADFRKGVAIQQRGLR